MREAGGGTIGAGGKARGGPAGRRRRKGRGGRRRRRRRKGERDPGRGVEGGGGRADGRGRRLRRLPLLVWEGDGAERPAFNPAHPPTLEALTAQGAGEATASSKPSPRYEDGLPTA